MKTLQPVISLQLMLAFGCASGPLNGSDQTNEAGATASAGDEDSTGDVFDIDPWVGGYHREGIFTLIGVENQNAPSSASLLNIIIREDFTATRTHETCSHNEPDTAHYDIEPLDQDNIFIWPTNDSEQAHWERAGLKHTKIERRDCNTLIIEQVFTSGRTVEAEWSRGNTCWTIHCKELGWEHYHVLVDYCEGEAPAVCSSGEEVSD